MVGVVTPGLCVEIHAKEEVTLGTLVVLKGVQFPEVELIVR